MSQSDAPTPSPESAESLEIVHLGVEGADAAGHAEQVRQLLQDHPGVREVRIEPDGVTVSIVFDARQTHAPELHDALLAGGYKPSALNPR